MSLAPYEDFQHEICLPKDRTVGVWKPKMGDGWLLWALCVKNVRQCVHYVR